MKSRMQRMKRTAARAARTTKKVAGKIAKRTRKVLKRVGKQARSRETRRQVARVLQGTGGVLETAGKAVVIAGAAAEVAAEDLRADAQAGPPHLGGPARLRGLRHPGRVGRRLRPGLRQPVPGAALHRHAQAGRGTLGA